MSYRVVVPAETERDIAELYDGFDSTPRAQRFVVELDGLFERIADRPLQFPVVHGTLRRALLRTLEYSIFFELDLEADVVVIHQVIHQRRDPALWRR